MRVKTAARQAKMTVQHPTRVKNVLNPKAWDRLRSLSDAEIGTFEEPENGIGRRSYGQYEDYVAHQKAKLSTVDLTEYDQRFHAALLGRLQSDGGWVGKSVLCLAARLGTEVRAFHDVGAFAVGIDLNPGGANPYVLPGDFHHLRFPDACADGVYSNSLDHSFDVERVAAEMRRVLKPTGTAVIEAGMGSAEGGHFREFEATEWETTDALLDRLLSAGFALHGQQQPFEQPWPGQRFVLEVR